MNEPQQDSHGRPRGVLFGFTRTDLSVPPFIFAGIGAAFLSAMGFMAATYGSQVRSVGEWVVAFAVVLFFPAFLIAIVRHRWASLPLWLCVAVILAPMIRHLQELTHFGERDLDYASQMLGVGLLTQAARLIRGNHRNKGLAK